MTLQKTMARGAMWTIIEKAGSQGISFIVFMFVARFIGPKEYGLANICFVTFALANLIILALVDGIVTLRISDQKVLSSLFWCVMIVGATLTTLCISSAGFVADIMHEPEIRPLLRYFSINFLCLAASVVPNKILYAALDFKIFAIRTLVASFVSGIVGFSMAMNGYGAYAIVAQQITLYVVMNIVIWRYVKWRPTFEFHTQDLVANLSPGFKFMGACFVGFVADQFPRILVAGFLGPVALGYYAFTNRIKFAIRDIFINPPLSVLYPSLSVIKDNKKEQELILGQVLSIMGFVVFPIIATVIGAAPIYTALLFGDAWKPAIPILQIAICDLTIVPILSLVSDVLRAHNRLGSYMKIQVPEVLSGLLITVILLPSGLISMSLGLLMFAIIMLPVYLHFLKRWVDLSLWKSILRLLKPLTASIFLFCMMYGFRYSRFYPQNDWVKLFSTLFLGFVTYCVISAIVQYTEFKKIIVFIRNQYGMQRK